MISCAPIGNRRKPLVDGRLAIERESDARLRTPRKPLAVAASSLLGPLQALADALTSAGACGDIEKPFISASPLTRKHHCPLALLEQLNKTPSMK
jgi:hypothetical protein